MNFVRAYQFKSRFNLDVKPRLIPPWLFDRVIQEDMDLKYNLRNYRIHIPFGNI
jgi:hypothetical protein